MAVNLLSLIKDINLQIQETQQIPNKIKTNKSMLRYSIIKLLRTRKQPEKLTHYRGGIIQMIVDLLETVQGRKKWHNFFQVLNEKNCQHSILYPTKISFQNEDEINILR